MPGPAPAVSVDLDRVFLACGHGRHAELEPLQVGPSRAALRETGFAFDALESRSR